MRRFFLSVLLLSAFCFPSFGQIRFIDENGEVYGVFGGDPGEEIFRYRVIYGRYPKDKKELLDFILDKERYEHIDGANLDYFNTQKKHLLSWSKSAGTSLPSPVTLVRST